MQLIDLTSEFPVESMVIGVVFWIVYIGELLLYRKRKGVDGHEKKVREAKARGHVVTAVLTSDTMYIMNEDKGKSGREYYARYEYEVNGKQYHKVERYTSKPPRSITLYYLDNPGKAFTKRRPTNMAVVPMIAIAALAAIAVKFLLF